jgi:dTDP-4-amino-4,6-dideoxygalactose transaminase
LINVSQPTFDTEVENEVIAAIRSGQIAQGPRVEKLEAMIADLTNCRFVVAVTSGTAALELALSLLDLHPGDEVLTTPFTFGATVNAIIHSGATATFVDVDPDGLMDVELIPEGISDRTRAIVPVHLYGQPVDLRSVALPPNLTVVEDAAQALGAGIGGNPVGGLGIGCFSFYATKNVTTGEGGAISTNIPDFAERARIIRNQGMVDRYEYVVPGRNLRMTDLQAAMGIPQISRISEIQSIRSHNANRLMEGLAGIPGLRLPSLHSERRHVWHQFTVRVTNEASVGRDALKNRLASRGIGTGIYYPRPLTDYPAFREHPQVRVSDLPNSRLLSSQVLSLPVHHGLVDADIDKIMTEVRHALGA